MELSEFEWLELFVSFKKYCRKRKEIYEKKQKKQRLPNFPEDISENLVRFFIEIKEGNKCKWNTKVGDLIINEKLKCEVKCFLSTGPTSFGPKEKWDILYFLDATDFLKNQFKIYKIELSSENKKILNLKVNKKQTFEDQCLQGRRPRLSFKQIKEQLDENDIKLVFSGKTLELFIKKED